MAVLGLNYFVNLIFPRKSSTLLKIRVVTTCVGGKHLVGKRVDASSAETFQPHCSFGSYQQSPSTTSLFLIPMISHSLSLSLSLSRHLTHSPMHANTHTHTHLQTHTHVLTLTHTRTNFPKGLPYSACFNSPHSLFSYLCIVPFVWKSFEGSKHWSSFERLCWIFSLTYRWTKLKFLNLCWNSKQLQRPDVW